MRQIKLSMFIVCLVASTLMINRNSAPAQKGTTNSGTLRFDPEWWGHISGNEQQGFIYGYIDCRQPLKIAKSSIMDYQNAVSSGVKTAKADDSSAVTMSIESAWKDLPSQKTDRTAEVYLGPHGFLDGEWWGEFTTSWPSDVESMDRGYLEGYLACKLATVNPQVVHRYQIAINKHYGPGNHSNDKIADVLQRLLKPPISAQK